MRASTRLRRTVALLMVGALALPLTAASSTSTPAHADATTAASAPARPAGAVTSIDDAGAAPDAAPAPKLTEDLQQLSRNRPAGDTTVEINGDDAAVAAAVQANGGTVIRGAAGLTLAKVPTAKLGPVAATSSVQSVRTPVDLRASLRRRVDTGVYNASNAISAQGWTQAGYTGAGSKVGIVSYFDPAVLTTEIANGEFADIPANHRLCLAAGQTCPFGAPGDTEGNSLAEIVADGAPSVALYLAEPGTINDFYAIIDWFASNGVTILVNPLIPAYDGPGDGTGPSAALVDYAVGKGITWFNGVGNFAANQTFTNYNGGYWRGTWSDPDNDRWLNFSGSDESLSVYCGALMGLRWSDFHAAVKTDYDLYISDFNASTGANGTKKLLSGYNQATGALPIEGNTLMSLCNTDPTRGAVYDTNKDGFVSLWVQRTLRTNGSPVGDVLEIGTLWGYMEYSSLNGSAALPFADSANPGEASVGGTNGGGRMFSSPGRGPTNDGRVKPDFVSTNCISTSVDGVMDYTYGCDYHGYYGTEAAAAVAAGWAALLRGPIGFVLPKDVVRYMRDNTYLSPDYVAGDPRVGYGELRPPDAPGKTGIAAGFVPEATPTRILETRQIGSGPIGVVQAGPLPPQTTIALNLPNDVLARQATAVLLNVGIVNAPAPGWLGVYPHAYSFAGGTSVLNVDTIGQTRSNQVVVPLDINQKLDLYTSNGGNVIVDVLGFFAPDQSFNMGYGRLRDVTPTTILDSKACVGISGCSGQPLAAGSYTDIDVRGFVDPNDALRVVPNDAAAVALSVTVDNPAAGGWMTALAGDQTTIVSSNLNYEAGKPATALAFVRVNGGANGVARFYLSRSAHLKVTILGWFTGKLGYDEPYGTFVSLNPRRLIDTRLPPISAKSLAGSSTPVQLSAGGVPTDAPVVLVDNVATQTAAAGIVQAAPTAPVGTPTRADLTVSAANQTIAASTITRTHAGSFVLATTTTTHLISDVAGYFLPRADTPRAGGPAQLLTAGPAGHGGNDNSSLVGIANDASVVLIKTYATDLAGQDTNSRPDYVIWHKSTNTVTMIDPTLLIDDANLSGDGSAVVFVSSANLVANDTNNVPDIYVLHLSDLSLALVTVDSNGVAAGGSSYWGPPSISDDGKIVAFESGAPLLAGDNNFTTDVFVRNVSAGTTRKVNAVTEPLYYPPTVSRDGAYVAYFTANLVMRWYTVATQTTTSSYAPGMLMDISADDSTLVFEHDTGNTYTERVVRTRATGVDRVVRVSSADPGSIGLPGGVVTSDGSHVLLLDKGSLRLRYMDVASSTGELIDVTWNGDTPSGSSFESAVTPDGRYVVFTSVATNLLSAPTTIGNVFLIDRGA